jgi:hypothetical protein
VLFCGRLIIRRASGVARYCEQLRLLRMTTESKAVDRSVLPIRAKKRLL